MEIQLLINLVEESSDLDAVLQLYNKLGAWGWKAGLIDVALERLEEGPEKLNKIH